MRTVLFDVDGVLVHGYHARPELRRCWDVHLAEDFGVERAHFAEHFIFKQFIQEVLVGKAPLRGALETYFQESDLAVDVDDFIDYWLEKDGELNAELWEFLRTTASVDKHALYVATNQCHERADYLMHQLGFKETFKGIFHSARIGAMKPDATYYDYIEKALGLRPEEITFFDDTPAVVAAARERGWHAHEFVSFSELEPVLREVFHDS